MLNHPESNHRPSREIFAEFWPSRHVASQIRVGDFREIEHVIDATCSQIYFQSLKWRMGLLVLEYLGLPPKQLGNSDAHVSQITMIT